jgi:hypothetical protein
MVVIQARAIRQLGKKVVLFVVRSGATRAGGIFSSS